MSNPTRIVLSLVGGSYSGSVGTLPVLVFGPLLFPASISGPTRGEGLLATCFPIFFLIFGTLGFVICWKFLARFVK
jgi:hypothetical protein